MRGATPWDDDSEPPVERDPAGFDHGTGDLPDDHYRDYPVVVRVAGRRCLVVGAGPVGARRARGLLECGARVTVVAPSAGGDMSTLLDSAPAGHVTFERRVYRDGEAAAYDLVIAATGDASVDRQVTDDALSAHALVAARDDRSIRAVHLPAVHREGPVTVAVSTAGRSPALSVWLRGRLAPVAGPHLAAMADLLAEQRRTRQARGGRPEDVDWHTAIERIAPLVESGRLDEARDLLDRLP